MIDYLPIEDVIEYLKRGLSFREMALEIEKRYGKKVSRQRVHKVYQQYLKKYKKELKNIKKKKNTIDINILKNLIDQRTPLNCICKEYNISYYALKKIMKKNKITKIKASKIIDKDTLYDLYINKGLTDKKIGEMYNYATSTITNLRLKYGIRKERRYEYQ